MNESQPIRTLTNPIQFMGEIFSQAYCPDPIETVSEWADKHRVLSSKEAEPGPYRTKRTPYLRDIMDDLSSHSPITKVVFMKGAQVGATDLGLNFMGYVIHRAPGRMISVMPRVEDAKKNSKSRIAPMIEECPALRNLVRDPRSRDSGNTILMKEFPGGELILTGSNSAAGLRSTPARYLFMDEIDAYPGDVEGEGDPVDLAEARTRTFKRKKIFMPSTPTVQGLSRIEREFERTDQRYYFVPCPHCHSEQILEFRRADGSFGLQWENESKQKAVYVCCNCGAQTGDEHKTWMLENGQWKPTVECSNPYVVGYHLSALYGPVGLGLSWTEIMRMWEDAQSDQEKLKTFVNTVLGETWVEKGDAPEWRRLYERRDDYTIGKVPAGGLFLTGGIDVQKDRLEISIWAWGRNRESWLVEHRILEGDTSRPEVWEKADGLVSETWENEDGVAFNLVKIAVDSGYATTEVYAWVRKHRDNRLMAVKGLDRFNVLLGLPTSVDLTYLGKRIKRGIKLWPVGVSEIKRETYRWLNLEKPTEKELETSGFPPGYLHFPKLNEEYFKQLTAESLIRIVKKGYPKTEWQKDRERNEALDCRVYARAASIAFGIEKFSEKDWRRLEEIAGQKQDIQDIQEEKPPVSESTPQQSQGPQLQKPQQRPRVIRSRYMNR